MDFLGSGRSGKSVVLFQLRAAIGSQHKNLLLQNLLNV